MRTQELDMRLQPAPIYLAKSTCLMPGSCFGMQLHLKARMLHLERGEVISHLGTNHLAYHLSTLDHLQARGKLNGFLQRQWTDERQLATMPATSAWPFVAESKQASMTSCQASTDGCDMQDTEVMGIHNPQKTASTQQLLRNTAGC